MAELLAVAFGSIPVSAQSDYPKLVDICSRTAAVREEILSLTGAGNCSAVTEADLEAITVLDFYNAGLTALQAGDFAGLSGLTSLRLTSNSLRALPSGLFDNLSSLITLLIARNEIVVLPLELFDDLRNLTGLDLAENTIGMLPSGIFDNLGALITLELAGNPIATLPEDTFINLPRLQMLSLGDSTVPMTLTTGVFNGLDDLWRLELHGMASLPAGVFVGLDGLRALLLRGVTSLGPGVFNGLEKLTWLSLQGVASLGPGVFDPLAAVTRLDLSNSPLLTLSEGVFDRLSSLKALNVFENDIAALPSGIFDELSNLSYLDLRENDIAALPSGIFDELSNLTHLDLEENAIGTLSSGIFDELSNLNLLQLEGNPIEVLPENTFTNLAELGILSLGAGTVPMNLTSSMFDGLDELWVLRLKGVTSLPADFFDAMPRLIDLAVSESDLSAFPSGVFGDLERLTNLNLSDNHLSILPEGILDGLSSLYWLVLSRNQFATFPEGVFEGLSSLRVMDLTDNQLNTLSAGVFKGLGSLRYLLLESNQLASLPEGMFAGLTELEGLLLSRNQLATLPEGMFAGLSNLQFLHLHGNPGSPFILTTELEPVVKGHENGTVELRLRVAQGAPFATTVTWRATGQIDGAARGRVTVLAGSLLSEPFSVTSVDSRGRIDVSLSDSIFAGVTEDIGDDIEEITGLALTTGDPLALDLATLLPIGEQIGHNEEIPGMPRGDWTPDVLSRAGFSQVNEQSVITFKHGGRIEEEGITYTCMSHGGCAIEGARVTEGTILVSETAEGSKLIVAGLAELVDDRTVFKEKTYNGFELDGSTATLRSVAGESTRVSFLDPDKDLVFVDFSAEDPATEMVITLEGFTGTLEESPYDQPETEYARGLATVTIVKSTELTWVSVFSLGNHVDRVDLALIEGDTFAGEANGIADIRAIVIEGEGSIGVIDAANANFIGSSREIGVHATSAVVKRGLSIGDITPSGTALPVLRISAESLDRANASDGKTVIEEIRVEGGDLREATGTLQIDTGEIVYEFPIVAVDGERSIRDSEFRSDLGDGILEAVTDTFVANPNDYFITDGLKTGAMSD